MASISELLSSILQPVNSFMNSSSTHSFRKPGFEAQAQQPQQPLLSSPAPQQQAPIAAYPGYQQAQQRGGFDSPPQQFDFGQAGDIMGELATGAADLFKKFTAPSPAPTQGPKMWREPTNQVLSFNEQGEQIQGSAPAPVATPRPVQPGDPNYRFAYETLPRDEHWAKNGPRPGFQPNQPPPDVGALIREFFPNEATAAAAVFASENGTFDPNRPDNINSNGTPDRGIPQINKGSFDGLMERQGNQLKEAGITSFEDMRDPRKSLIVSKMLQENSIKANQAEGRDTAGWGPWYGWQDTGYDLNKGWFSKEDRGNYEVAKKKKKK